MVWLRRPSRQALVLGSFLALSGTCSLTAAGTPARVTDRAQKALPTAELVDPDALLARAEQEGAPIWADGQRLTVIYQGEAATVELCCGLQEPLERLPGSDVWVLRRTVPDLHKAVFSYSFVVDGDFDTEPTEVWRGPDAPEAPRRADLGTITLRGTVSQSSLRSRWLDEYRSVSVYLPPNADEVGVKLPVLYMADGESAGVFAGVLEPLILSGRLPPIVIVGVHSPSPPTSGEAPDLRAQEYIPSSNPERFRQHERFVLREVIPWAEANLPVSAARQDRAVFGFSNGGVFAAAMGLRHPDVFAHVLAFSLGVTPGPVKGNLTSDFYLVAGTLEEGFFGTTRDLAAALEEKGVNATFRPRVAGHDFVMWEEELPGAVAWDFGEGSR